MSDNLGDSAFGVVWVLRLVSVDPPLREWVSGPLRAVIPAHLSYVQGGSHTHYTPHPCVTLFYVGRLHVGTSYGRGATPRFFYAKGVLHVGLAPRIGK